MFVIVSSRDSMCSEWGLRRGSVLDVGAYCATGREYCTMSYSSSMVTPGQTGGRGKIDAVAMSMEWSQMPLFRQRLP